jgi:hypothetical protein
LFRDLCHLFNARPNRKGEVYIPCPSCGKPAGDECSFSERGWHCFVCGQGGSLKGLADKVGLETGDDWQPPKPKPKRRRHYRWQDRAGELMVKYAQHPAKVRLWQEYKPIGRGLINEHRLGVGQLPSSRCKHPRLIVPLLDFDHSVVGFRGRAIDCDCVKWLSPAGNRAALYNWQAVRRGDIVFVVENAIDALMLTERTDAVAVATLSISYWEPEWTQFLVDKRPEAVVVAYDNHWPAMGTHRERWLEDHDLLPMPSGMRLFNRLSKAGLEVELYDWGDAPVGYDVGNLLELEKE